MKEVLHLFLCFMISFGLARDGQTDLKEKSRPYAQGIQRTCPAPFKQIGSEYLYFHDSSKKNWDDALKHCKSIGGSLAEPANMDDFIDLITSSYSHMTLDIWLGATDRSDEQNWKWLSGGSVPSSLWPAWPGNQPSGDGDCMQIHYHGYSGFFLNDYYCHVKGYFVCECTPQITTDYPYIEPKCCNLSTTARCSRMGSDGFKGHCMPRNETCLGREYYGSKYCVISKHQSCKCCVPTDCKRQTLSPCFTLNGTCIGLNDQCNGTSIVSGEFCKRDSKIDTCKCCFPLVPKEEKEDCPCGQDYNGQCLGFYPREHISGGKEAKGRCMETCALGHTPLIDHTCNKTGGKDCKCCKPIGSCPKPFKQIGSEFLYFHDSSKKNWDGALKHCKSLGGSLAEPANMDDFIDLIKSSYFDMRPTIWLGATDRSTEQNWKWLSGGSVPSSLWPITPVNQPDGDGDCMEIHYRYANGYTGFYLNDYNCDVEGYFVCECTPRITTD